MGKLALGNQEVQQDRYVISRLLRPLLGRPAIEALHVWEALQLTLLGPRKYASGV